MRGVIPNKYVFLVVLCLFLFAAAALMEIYAALVVLVPLLLPLAKAYGIDPVPPARSAWRWGPARHGCHKKCRNRPSRQRQPRKLRPPSASRTARTTARCG